MNAWIVPDFDIVEPVSWSPVLWWVVIKSVTGYDGLKPKTDFLTGHQSTDLWSSNSVIQNSALTVHQGSAFVDVAWLECLQKSGLVNEKANIDLIIVIL